MNWETLIAYIVGLLSTLVCAVCFYLLGMAHGLARAGRPWMTKNEEPFDALFPAGAGMPPAAADAQNGGRGDGAAGGSSPAVHGRANYEP